MSDLDLLKIMCDGESYEQRLEAMGQLTERCIDGVCEGYIKRAKGLIQQLPFSLSTQEERRQRVKRAFILAEVEGLLWF